MDGGGITVANDGKVVSIFRRKQEIILAAAGQPEQVLATGKDPAIAANGEGVFVAWSGADGVMAKVPGSADARRLDAEGGFPQLIALPGGTVLAAWERKGEIEFQRLSAGASRF